MAHVLALLRRVGVSSAEAVALAVLAAGALVAVGLLYVGTRPAPVPLQPPAVQGTAAGAPSEQPSELVVHVAGLVRRPGLVQLPKGARVADAITAAGGPLRRASLDALNLARPITDGEQLVVTDGSVPAPAGSASPGGAASEGQVLYLNQATLADLEQLPGIGPVLAQRILDHRDAIGGFTSVAQLRDVDGIGEKTFQSLAPLVTP